MYQANEHRYDKMQYHRVGNSGLKLPAISLGLWHNFGNVDKFSNQREIICGAFDMGITHFDLANNYGPPAGSAEENFGRILAKDLAPYRDELIISSKAGYYMWPGPYGEWGSKKNVIASCDQSLKRLGLDYVDIFYHHRPDPDTPLEETAQALDLLVRQGKALYIGISNYSAEDTVRITEIFKELKTPFIIHQPAYSMFNRWIEDGLKDALVKEKLGAIAFSPLSQGLLTNRYLNGVPEDSRANRSDSPFLSKENVDKTLEKVSALNEVAQERGQTLAEMAIAWILRDGIVTSVLVGASRLSQLEDNVKALENTNFTTEELAKIDHILIAE
ncbi:L-glyceraldehyde 3-phosphate reductase [Enterococcus sp. PF1-24]|uniref:L-glyceraldehyde 3-phosphate reductase n=1 Tax=unclassified Enterococcus TaxID=2608891 RepID=UPI0024758A5D|nr:MULTISPECIES: L-glyceraldehyde 3-phosphate reductase [unclassified Enterococcus]MDH6365415.1 L-glyceraldehyde 3-phosphate reductase [Enterococcus sp. PFB1-1]MDH6402513.1 L-glyceraldehyde 3-phosphate reductase [Enterococcus sp. PF1-24]